MEKVQGFVDEPTPEVLEQLKKAELLEAARILEIPVGSSVRKADIKDLIRRC